MVRQRTNSVTVDIPAGDPGWQRSNPERGRFKWRGDRNGIRTIRAIDRSATRRGAWIITVGGREVPGASSIDLRKQVVDVEATVEVTMEGVCAQGEH